MRLLNKYAEFKQLLVNIDLNNKPRLLLHSCCGPCSSHVLSLLMKYFDVTVYYYNPNIYPEAEFNHRAMVQADLINKLNPNVKLLIEEAPYELFLQYVEKYKDLGEKSIRCYECYKFRMEHLQAKAIQYKFDYFTTTLSVSPHKNSEWINEIGESLSTSNCQYLYSDFKKEDGYLDSIRLAKKYDLYRQAYCGCSFSLEEATKKKLGKA